MWQLGVKVRISSHVFPYWRSQRTWEFEECLEAEPSQCVFNDSNRLCRLQTDPKTKLFVSVQCCSKMIVPNHFGPINISKAKLLWVWFMRAIRQLQVLFMVMWHHHDHHGNLAATWRWGEICNLQQKHGKHSPSFGSSKENENCSTAMKAGNSLQVLPPLSCQSAESFWGTAGFTRQSCKNDLVTLIL